MADYSQGSVSVGTTATLVCSVGAEDGDGVLVANTGATAVFLGGRSLTASGATQGVPLAAGATITVPTLGSGPRGLFAITATGSSTVNFLFPALP